MKDRNQMICDIETGICGIADEAETEIINLNQPKKSVQLYYVTDPICSHCWALEPVLRRFTEQYGEYFHFQTVMGGLLEKWHDGPIDPKNGIYKPADVVPHWKEVGENARMPIDGSLMADNPVQSSYPPSRVFKVIQQEYNESLAEQFLRRAREALFVFNQNIAEPAVMTEIVHQLGLDGTTIFQKVDQPLGQQLLQDDFTLAAKLGVRGFPSIIMVNEENQGVKIAGTRPLQAYIDGLKQVLDTEDLSAKQSPSLASLLQKEQLLFAKEIEVMYDLEPAELDLFIEKELASQAYKIDKIFGEFYLTWNGGV
ncbi:MULTISPECIES: DsbA family protein [Gracilibacillus]|uniref:DsbA family protein n=1 Tax=Gracilibacillus TaxID=74385 RepID=UPI0008264D9F|nr:MULTISPECIES: DsbA family protein [Gracilibacillus]